MMLNSLAFFIRGNISSRKIDKLRVFSFYSTQQIFSVSYELLVLELILPFLSSQLVKAIHIELI
jgi:hypothetical protein